MSPRTGPCLTVREVLSADFDVGGFRAVWKGRDGKVLKVGIEGGRSRVSKELQD